MPNVAIIGAGQLGSRHLQGATLAQTPLQIYVVDPGEQSRRVALERFNQVAGASSPHSCTMLADYAALPAELDVAIIATDSRHRMEALKSLLAQSRVKSVVLEKFLFPHESDYAEAARLLEAAGAKAYVNCPRRIWPVYAEIRKRIGTDTPIIMSKTGHDWGLCCNAIHFIDTFLWLSGQSEYSVQTDGLIPALIPSKRNGYVELQGSLEITTPRGDRLTLSSAPGEEPALVSIAQGEEKITLDEGAGKLQCTGPNPAELTIATPYQSGLTGGMIDRLLAGEEPGIAGYAESSACHLQLFGPLLDVVNSLRGEKGDMLPVT